MVRKPITLFLLIPGLLLMGPLLLGASLLITTPTKSKGSISGQNQIPLNTKSKRAYPFPAKTANTVNTANMTNTAAFIPQSLPTEANPTQDILDDIAHLEIILPTSTSLGANEGEFQIIDGEVYELTNGDIIKTTRLEIEGFSKIVICMERYTGIHRVSQEFYDGEELEVTYPPGVENQSTILSTLSDRYRYTVRDSKVYVYIPFNKKISVSKFLEQINQEISGVGISSLIKKDF